MSEKKTYTAVFTVAQIAAMNRVADGADVLDYGIAMDLRAVQRDYPQLIRIGKRKGRYSGAGRLPYFGAILTDEGRAAILKATGDAS